VREVKVAWLCDFDPYTYLGGAELSDRAVIEYFKQDEKIKALMGWKGIVLRNKVNDIL